VTPASVIWTSFSRAKRGNQQAPISFWPDATFGPNLHPNAWMVKEGDEEGSLPSNEQGKKSGEFPNFE
jgi:hypothetical protein